MRAIHEFARVRRLSGPEKDDLLSSLADALGLDYEMLCHSRILHIMSSDEVRRVAKAQPSMDSTQLAEDPVG